MYDGRVKLGTDKNAPEGLIVGWSMIGAVIVAIVLKDDGTFDAAHMEDLRALKPIQLDPPDFRKLTADLEDAAGEIPKTKTDIPVKKFEVQIGVVPFKPTEDK